MSAPEPTAVDPAFRPSDYTAALLQLLLARPEWARDARVLDVGCGSGVLLAAAGSLGASLLCGVDIEADAVAASARLLSTQGLDAEVELFQGDLFAPVRGRRFDLVLANLPHFPMRPAGVDDRLPSWSSGGGDGRALLDRFLAELDRQLSPGGQALLVHNAFVDLERTRARAAFHGLRVELADRVLVPLPPAKLERMTAALLAREAGHSIHLFGPHAFGEVHVLSLGSSGAEPAGSP